MASFGLILMVFMLIAAKFGQGIFAQKIRYDLDDNQIEYFAPLNNTVSRMHSVPESNFDSLTDSMISVFIVLTNDGWVAVYSEFYRFVSKTKSTIFFLSLVIIGSWILFNLLLAILLKEFDERTLIHDRQQETENIRNENKKNSCYQKICKILSKKKPENQQGGLQTSTNCSLYLF
jgi:hypothetical protein